MPLTVLWGLAYAMPFYIPPGEAAMNIGGKASTALAACEEATTAPSSPPSPRQPTRRDPSAVAMAHRQAEELRELSIAMAPAPDAASGATAQGIVDQRA